MLSHGQKAIDKTIPGGGKKTAYVLSQKGSLTQNNRISAFGVSTGKNPLNSIHGGSSRY